MSPCVTRRSVGCIVFTLHDNSDKGDSPLR
jgi:hypothetical protein